MKDLTNNSLNNSLDRIQGKDMHFQAQMDKVFNAFYKQPKTMLMVSIETGILRANICRYVAEFRKVNQIQFVKFGICPKSKYRAGFYTTDHALFPIVEPLKSMKL